MQSILGLFAQDATGNRADGPGGVILEGATGQLVRSTSEFLNGASLEADTKSAVAKPGAGASSRAGTKPPPKSKSKPKPNTGAAVPVAPAGTSSCHLEVARKAYSTRYTGLEGYGDSGMTVLEELIDIAFQLCEKQSKIGQDKKSGPKANAIETRAAALLASDGRVYTGVDVFAPHMPSSAGGGAATGDKTAAEMVALLGAAAENCSSFVGLIIASDSLPPGEFPVPDGRSREYMRGFGLFPVYLVNSCLECRSTDTNELFPVSGADCAAASTLAKSFSAPLVMRSISNVTTPSGTMVEFDPRSSSNSLRDVVREEDMDVLLEKWTVNDVVHWLKHSGFEDYADEFGTHRVDGQALCHMTQEFLRDKVGIAHALHRKKLLRLVEHKRAAGIAQQQQQRGGLDDMDDYVMMLDTQRISLVAKLKVVFDAFVPARADADADAGVEAGLASGQVLEQILNYMNKPVDSVDVNRWLESLKEAGRSLSFAEFVSQYCSLFGGHDPDVPLGEGHPVESELGLGAIEVRSKPKTKTKSKSKSKSIKSASNCGADGEHWIGDSASDGGSFSGSGSDSESGDVQRRRVLPLGPTVDKEDILNIKVLAELKTAFDRFAADGLITPTECIQGLSEVGLIVPRKDVISYLRVRQLLGITRNISYYEFLRGFAALK